MKNLIYSLVFFLSLLSALHAEDWGPWRGPRKDGISLEKNWNYKKLLKNPKPLWNFQLGKGHSAVATKGDFCYSMGNKKDRDIIYCINNKNGKEVWNYDYACKAGNFAGPRCTPVLDDDKVYTMSRSGLVLCLNAKTGKKVWDYNVSDGKFAKLPKWGLSASPCIEGDMVILNAGEAGIALNKKSGKVIWKNKAGTAGYATPHVFMRNKKECVAIFSSKKLFLLNLKDGKIVGDYDWVTKHDVNAATPISFDKYIFIASAYGHGGTLLDVSAKPKEVWFSQNTQNHFSNWIYHEGYLYGCVGGTKGASISCINAKTGEFKWKELKGSEAMLATKKELIVLDKTGKLHIVQLSPKSFKSLGSVQIFNIKKSTYWTMPILSNGKLYFRESSGSLLCFDVSR
ncbi:MAG: PQQ-like beta-propeller repeat protein [Planctomycetes bacterium]|nr:PQQ-like beta-propeller repeat protein [Planctomycetota bacterium]